MNGNVLRIIIVLLICIVIIIDLSLERRMIESFTHTQLPLISLVNNLSKSNKIIDVLVPGGNKGDGLIYEGAYQVFKKYGLKYNKKLKNELNINNKTSDTLIILGSGGFSEKFHSVVNHVIKASTMYDDVYVFPSTYVVDCEPVREMVSKLPKNVSLFCREKKSYNDLKRLAPYPEHIYLDNDTAFLLDYTPWKKKGKGTLYAFRNDDEKSSINIPKENIDASKGNYTEWEDLLNTISKYNVIHTNRAHGMIAASMLGKETYAYDSNHFKQREIYKNSLSHMRNVHFIQ